MKGKLGFVTSLMICLTIIFALPLTTFALSNRPQYDEKGNAVPNPFADNDAERYGGLFGPLPAPDTWDNWATALKNPQLVNPFSGMPHGIHARDMGFDKDPDHFLPINRDTRI